MSEWADTVERDDGMDGENYHIREVYANFGLAVYHAQVIGARRGQSPHSCQNFPRSCGDREMFAPVMEQCFAQVFGRLVNEAVSYSGGRRRIVDRPQTRGRGS